MNKSVDIAKFIIYCYGNLGVIVNMTKLQKTLFCVYGIAMKNGILITKEMPIAWPYGPIFTSIKNVKLDLPIDYTQSDSYFNINPYIVKIIHNVTRKLKDVDSNKLSKWSCSVNSPWFKTTIQPNFEFGVTTIPNDFIVDYFSEYTQL